MKVTCDSCKSVVDEGHCFQVYDLGTGKASYLCTYSCVLKYEENTRRQAKHD